MSAAQPVRTFPRCRIYREWWASCHRSAVSEYTRPFLDSTSQLRTLSSIWHSKKIDPTSLTTTLSNGIVVLGYLQDGFVGLGNVLVQSKETSQAVVVVVFFLKWHKIIASPMQWVGSLGCCQRTWVSSRSALLLTNLVSSAKSSSLNNSLMPSLASNLSRQLKRKEGLG